jgi:PilZ domain
MHNETKPIERREKVRFPLHRELRYKLLEDDTIVASGCGETLDVSSGGVSMSLDQPLTMGAFVELSVSWPVLLDQTCPMRLIAFGRVVRIEGKRAACTIDKYEFRTQARKPQVVTPIRSDTMLQRWADGYRKETVKARAAIGA